MAKRRFGQRKNAKPKSESEAKVEFRMVPISRDDGNALPPVYANNILIQADQSVFTLFFYRVNPPLIGDEDKPLTSGESAAFVPANCVARIVLPAHIMASTITALQSSFQKNTAAVTALQQAMPDAQPIA